MQKYSLLQHSSSTDFEFDVGMNGIDKACYSSADELFSNGKILPLRIKKEISGRPQQQQQQQQPQNRVRNYINIGSSKSNGENESKMSCSSSSSKYWSSVWELKRSSSLSLLSGYKRRWWTSSTLLSRSNSTGQVLKESRCHGNYNQRHKVKLQQQHYSSTSNRKPPSKKSTFGYGSIGIGIGNAIPINPILNVPLVDVDCFSSLCIAAKARKK